MLDKRKRILIVDDNPDDIHVLKEPLKEYAILAATSGERALEMAVNSQPDIIILDAIMPEMDGYEVCKKLKSSDETKEINVIFVSAHDTTHEKLKSYEVGGSDYLIKPIQPTELLHKIALAVSNSEQHAIVQANANSAMRTAQTAIKTIGEIGLVQEFMRDSYKITSSKELASLITMSITHYGLESCVKIISNGEASYTSSQDSIAPIEKELLSCVVDEATLLERGARLIVNYGDISLLVKNMPKEEDRRGRLRDNLASLIEFANTRLSTLDQNTDLSSLVQETNKTIAEIQQSLEKQCTTTLQITDSIAHQLTELFSEVGLSEFQETNVQKLMESITERLLKNLATKKDVDEKIRTLTQQVNKFSTNSS